MSLQPITINNVSFAKNKSLIEGDLPVADLPRLREWLGATEDVDVDLGTVKYQLKGDVDGAKQSVLALNLDAEVIATCQRCMGSLSIPLTMTFNYLITHLDEAQILTSEDVEEGDDVDLMTEDREMNLTELIEEEVIAAMPYSATHAHDCASLKKEAGEKPNPFSALKGLVGK
jgi:uncharacterized protein